ncbi:hypothetical protein LTR91_005281 [Friedmanniomyces endolithicus]|uniref:Peptidase A1 domain-containing protein n=2 Tax=Dothideomycetidae TaxID=451867 RepID=A0A4U0V764_9PEZI|nr:hypothetical protein LTS09_013688 [Friedmanniomyces endolithicus]KAK5148136.1 hypothetical protein LTR32_000523 [Rachicladosporium monterosium]KAK0791517.1 hypothetical protein LTR59_008910 [Friedmanniomyces endolithicus]KAK0808257.1 hypothetical protein LTR75_006321 [Friedmanniomyces endolithicus]KAK0810462.1 hypothetical protein LTR38_003947 [Friedmanniomyces endolithicus]
MAEHYCTAIIPRSCKKAPWLCTSSGHSGRRFWYGTFNIGARRNLSLLIDTGSSDVSTNPDLYKPSPSSLDLHRDGVLSYSTGEEDGCGTANISYHTYADAVSFAGSTACNQTFAVVIAKPPPNNGTITQFPNQGIVGFSRTFASATQLDAIPFFQTLCNEGSVRECKFGLALGTDGTSTQISGATDRKIYVGHLVTVDADPNEVVAFDGAITANGITTLTGATIISDSGTANIVGPTSDVRKLFDILGIEDVRQNLPGCTAVLFGYYPCDAPPTIGFSPGSSTRPFDIEPSASQQADNGNNNCTAIVTGIDLSPVKPLWLLDKLGSRASMWTLIKRVAS